MASLIPGFEYDIFISYRQKDNKGERWVTEFVQALKTELEATFKEDISIYFDQNPNDGLLESHHVDKSLEGKLNCLVFIPILSKTYCDPKSFAWQHEFCAFNRMAQGDSMGRDIKLGTGNVSSRILPITIHDLDAEDRSTIEAEIGGAIRGIEFIYKEPGVNRALRQTDSKTDNLNRTDYRNQINKVALAIRDILLALQRRAPAPLQSMEAPKIATQKSWARFALPIMLVAALMAIVYVIKVQLARPEQVNQKSIAVLPFTDLTPDHSMEYFSDGIADEIINSLTTIKDLNVSGRTSSFQFKNEKVDIRTVGTKLQVAFVLEGSVQKYEDNFRITAQLVRTSDNFHAWSQRFDLNEVNIFKIQDAIASSIVEKLKVTLSDFERQQLPRKETKPEAYTEYLKGMHQFKEARFRTSISYFEKAIRLDPEYAPPYAFMGMSVVRSIDRSKRDSVDYAVGLAQRAIALDQGLPEAYSAMGLIGWMGLRDFAIAQENFEKSIELNPSSSLTKNRYGYFLTWMGDFKKSTRMAIEALQMDPADYNGYYLLFLAALCQNELSKADSILTEYERVLGRANPWQELKITLDIATNPQQALRLLDSASNSGSRDLTSLVSLGKCYYLTGRKKESDRIMEIIRKYPPTEPDYYYQRACLYAVQGNADSCLHDLERSARRYETAVVSMKVDPDFEKLKNHPKYLKLYRMLGYDRYRFSGEK
ncbi:MAG: hypothetical protein JNN04_14105 [Cyclobacteriaceae bacterium]|nr:hypothetical protein [Cyclobacteriaceae bacterium]